jgi:glycosyltransferase A (GT-A) superfamily protein (DUF2064 family)
LEPAINTNTALLIFSKSVLCEAADKNLALTRKSSIAISNFLINKTVILAKSTKLPYFIVDETMQIGDTFGQKITHAFNFVFSKGFQNVIVIGNDCPSLTKNEILIAEKNVVKNGAVIGPTFAQGAYLIGMNIQFFDPKLFSKISWKTEQTLESLSDYFQSKLTDDVISLSIKYDINYYFDWSKVIKQLPSLIKNQIFSALLAGYNNSKIGFVNITSKVFLSTTTNLRGPPSLATFL